MDSSGYLGCQQGIASCFYLSPDRVRYLPATDSCHGFTWRPSKAQLRVFTSSSDTCQVLTAGMDSPRNFGRYCQLFIHLLQQFRQILPAVYTDGWSAGQLWRPLPYPNDCSSFSCRINYGIFARIFMFFNFTTANRPARGTGSAWSAGSAPGSGHAHHS